MKKLFPALCSLVFFAFAGCGDSGKKPDAADQPQVAEASAFPEWPKGIYFVSNFDGKPSLYFRGFNDTANTVVWNRKNESVIDVRYSKDKKVVFFLTAAEQGKPGIFPFIKGLKLYRFDYDRPGETKLCGQTPECIYYSFFFENNDLLRFETSSFADSEQKTVTNTRQLYSLTGVMLENQSRSVDITKEGFPQISKESLEYTSKDGKYAVLVNKEENIVLKELSSRNYDIVVKKNKPLTEVGFTADNSYAVISLADVSPNNETLYDDNPETSELIIYSVKDKSVKFHTKGGGYKRFLIFGDLLVYENGFGDKSGIVIMNIVNMQEVAKIRLKGGSGLLNIPSIPDYDA